MDLAFTPAWRLAELTRSGEVGCLELLDAAIARVERLDQRINAVVVRDFERGRERARALDQGGRDDAGPLFGVPMTVKESYNLRGHPTTFGYPERAGHRAEEDALSVQRVEAAGAVVFGKTNVPVALGDWQSYNPIYGATANPWNADRTPGGSSGGSAASIASGFAALELGSDIGGSVRVPAHFCGVFGHKPTFGLVPTRGHWLMPAASMTDISVHGPLARSARDLGLAMDLLGRPDPLDTDLSYVLPEPRTRTLKEMRIAVWSAQPGQATSADTTAMIEALAEALEREGATVSRTARPAFNPDEAFRTYLTLLDAAWSGRLTEPMLAENRAALAALAEDDRSADAVMLRATDITHRQWLQANERRHVMRRAWQNFFREWDVLLCPSFAVTALPHMQEGKTRERRFTVDGQTVPYNDMLFWPGITCGFHLPGTTAPIGLAPDGLPMGVQIAGPLFGDRITIAMAEMLEAQGHAFAAPPGWE
jgi:amidase